MRLKIGIVGVEPGRSWAARAHIPALRALPEQFEIAGIANTSLASAQAAAAATGIPRAYADVAAMLADPSIDIVTVAVRVPHHAAVVTAALQAGKHVYCEWPLAIDLAEAEKLAALAKEKGVLAVIGTQAIAAPEVAYLRDLVAQGFIGDVLSTTVFGTGGPLQGGGAITDKKAYGYLIDRANGAHLLTIPAGHTLAAMRHVFGAFGPLSATLATRRPVAIVAGTGEQLPVTAPDQVILGGAFASGIPLSLHYRGGTARAGDGLLWDIHGTKGDLRLRGPSGHTQMVALTLEAVRDGEAAFTKLPVPAGYLEGWPQAPEVGNVARLYAMMADDIRDATRTAPGFDDAVSLHRVIAAIEHAAESGQRIQP